MHSNKILLERILNVRIVMLIIIISLISVIFMGCVSENKDERNVNTLAPTGTTFGDVQIVFKNKQIEKAVRMELGKKTGEITNQELGAVNYLNLNFSIESVEDIKELTCLTNLSDLELKIVDGIDISPLAELPKLSALRLDGQPADLTSLLNFKQLSYLSLLSIEDITNVEPIKKLSSLTGMGVRWVGPNCISVLKDSPNIKQVVFWEGIEYDFPAESQKKKYSIDKIRKRFPKVSFQGIP